MADEKKSKRIAAEDFWKMRDSGKAVEKKQSKYQKWLRKKARAENCYHDQIVNVLTGKIQTDPSKDHPHGEIRRMSDKFLEDAEARFGELNDLLNAHNDLCDKTAKEYGTTVDLLDPKTGVIGVDQNDVAEKVKPESIIKPIGETVAGETETGRPEPEETEDKD